MRHGDPPPAHPRLGFATAGFTASTALLAVSCASGELDRRQAPDTFVPPPVGAEITVEQSEYGDVLVDGQGLALYLFVKDENGRPTCYDACADAWPPLTVAGPAAASGQARETLLGTTTRTDGTMQVTYGGHPLYYYAPDKTDTFKGHDLDQFGAEW